MTRRIKIYDTTLRDGSQGEEISFSLSDKLRIAARLDDLSVHYIEGGWPGANPKDTQFFKDVKKLGLKNARLVAFGSTRKKAVTPNKDQQVKNLLASGAPAITIVGKTWDFHVREVLRCSPAENLMMIADTIDYLKSRGREVIFDAEHFFDAFAANRTYTEEVLLAASRAGADCICLCDTNGGSLPAAIAAVTAEVHKMLPTPLGIHCHNDCELAVANTLAAVEAGAEMVQGTINGIGERAGNANLCSIIPVLSFKLGMHCLPPQKVRRLREASHFVYELALMAPPTHQPFVGDSAFAHKGGQHGDAVRKSPTTYEHLDPELVGNHRRFIISDLSGATSIAVKAEEYGYDLPREAPEAKSLLQQVKLLEEQGYQFEGAEASFELLMREALARRKKFFEFQGFRVIDEKQSSSEPGRAEATVRLSVKGRGEAHTAAVGVGPVNALDNALRKALEGFFPSLREVRLVDFKVRVLPAGLATASKVRVLIESSDGRDTWGTVGVSENVIEASWQALIDSIDYKLYKDEKEKKRRGRK